MRITSRGLALTVLGALGLGVAIAAGVRSQSVRRSAPLPPRPAAPTAASPTTAPIAPAGWPWPSEEQWIVTSIALDVAEMVLYGNGGVSPDLDVRIKALPGEPAGRFDLSLRAEGFGDSGFTHTLEAGSHPWDPSPYARLAGSLLSRLGRQGTPAEQEGGSILSALLRPTSEVLQGQNQRISRRLEKGMLDPHAHQQAALLVACLSLREAPGRLSDVRQQLSRLTAHLAMAHALRADGAPSVDGALASIALSALVGRQREAVEALDRRAAPSTSASEKAWLLALRMRSTGDWRLVAEPKRASLLERLEHVRALVKMRTPLDAYESLNAAPPPALVDWGRILLAEGRSTVEVENALAGSVLSAEIDEIRRLFLASEGRALEPARLVDELAPVPGRCVSRGVRSAVVRIIDWGTWAAYSERHLLGAIAARQEYLESTISVSDDASNFRWEMKKAYGALPLFSLVEQGWPKTPPDVASRSSRPSDPKFCAPAAALILRSPERVGAGPWRDLQRECAWSLRAGVLAAAEAWFHPAVVRGTTLDYASRRELFRVREVFAAVVPPLLELAPYEPLIAIDVGAGTAEEIERGFAPVKDYWPSVHLMLVRAAGRDQGALLHYSRKACEALPESCASLADDLARLGLEQEALPLFERGRAHARDRVAMANLAGWAVGYYFDLGQTDKAVQLAREGALVYTASALTTLAQLHERLGQYAKAESVYREMINRYPDEEWELQHFYVRYKHRVGDDRFEGKVGPAMRSVFPGGMQRVSAKDLDAGSAGVPVTPAIGVSLRRAGVGLGDTIVAVDGYRVWTFTQYICVMRLTDSGEVHVIVNRTGRIVELKGPVRRRHYGPRTVPE